jgi:hypothetical protein
VQFLGGPVREGGLHAAGAGLADTVGCRPACGGELDELGTAVAGVRHAVRVADLLQPLHLPGYVRCLHSQPGGLWGSITGSGLDGLAGWDHP